jgi:DNA repair protein RecO (recombination protein O)
MNHFSDIGIIISVRQHGESGAVIHVLSENNGKCGGYVNGAQASGRLRSVLQQGNIVSVDWQSKSEGQLGRFDVELEQDISASLLSDAKSLLAVQSACGLMDMFLPDREKQDALFHGTCALLNILKTDQWPAVYITWEMAFLKEMGYGIDISKCAVSGVTDNLTHVSPKSGRAVCAGEAEPYKSKLLDIPQFMQGHELADDDIAKGLKLTGYFLMHRLLQHSSYHALPDARHQLENSMDSL